LSPRKVAVEAAYRFSISPQDAALTEPRIQELLAKATKEAEADAKQDGYDVQAKSGLEGKFLGLGEATALLILVGKSTAAAKVWVAAEAGSKILAKAVLEGAGVAGGKLFFDKYLAPRLRKMNLLPSKFQPARKASSSPKPAEEPKSKPNPKPDKKAPRGKRR
jgi:hypothetical protein